MILQRGTPQPLSACATCLTIVPGTAHHAHVQTCSRDATANSRTRVIQDYDKAIALNPDYANAYNNRGVVYGAKGNYALAIQDYGKAIALKPDLAKAYNNRGMMWLLLKEWDKARSDLTTAKERGVPIAKSPTTFFASRIAGSLL